MPRGAARILAFCGLLLISQAGLPGEAPAGNIPRLRVSSGGHYLFYRGRPLMLVGDSGTQCVLQDLNLNYRRWLDDCAERGISAVHVWALLAPRQTRDGKVLERRYGYVYPGATPWRRRRGGPPAADGFPRWDLTRFDEGTDPARHYWPRLRDLCRYAQKRGLVLGITVFFGWPKHNTRAMPDWRYHPFNRINGGFLSERKALVTVVQRILAPDREIRNPPWRDDWPPAEKTQWVWERFADKLIRETRPFGNVFFVFMDEHSYSEGNCGEHFLHFFKKRGALYADWERRRAQVDIVHDDARNPSGDANAACVRAFYRKPVRPVITLEAPPYRGAVVRLSIWSRLMAGHHYIFHDDGGQETVQTGIMVYDPHVRGGRREKVLQRLDWLGNASRFFNRSVRNLDAMAPHNELVRGRGKLYCLAAPGAEYAVYSWEGAEAFELNLSRLVGAGCKLTARFYDPRAGRWRKPFQPKPGAWRHIAKPDARDWLLYLRALSPGAHP